MTNLSRAIAPSSVRALKVFLAIAALVAASLSEARAVMIFWDNGSGSGEWNLTDLNFSGTFFANGDDVVFGDVGAGTVNIAPNLLPGSVTFNNGLGNDYTFTGAAIGGSGAVNVNGAGAVAFTASNRLPFQGALTIAAGSTLNIHNDDRVGSLAGEGNVKHPDGNQNNKFTFGVNNQDTTFSGVILESSGGSGFIRKVGTGTFTYNGSQLGDIRGLTLMDGTVVMTDSGSVNGISILSGSRAIADNTGTLLENRFRNVNLGGELIVQGNAAANTLVGGPNNTPFHADRLGNPVVTLNPADGFEAQYAQRNGGNTGMFSIGNGNALLVRGDNLGEMSGTRSRFTIRSLDLNQMMVGGAGQVLTSNSLSEKGTPQVSILPRAYVDDSSSGLGQGFVTYDLGFGSSQNPGTDIGLRLLAPSEYANTINDGDGAVLSTIANTRLNSAVSGINGATRINSLLLDQGGSVSGSGALTVESGMFMSLGSDAAIHVSQLEMANRQATLITPEAGHVLTISSDLDTTGGLVKVGEGTVILTNSANSYTGATTISNGALRAVDGASLPTDSNLLFTGGVFETSGTFSRGLGNGADQVRWLNDGTNGFADGGFAAVGGDLDIQLGGGTGTLTWNAGSFVAGNRALVFGSASADSVVDFQNGLNLGAFNDTTGGDRVIRVVDNPSSSNDRAVVSGTIVGSDPTVALHKKGDGTLELASDNTYAGQTVVHEGTLQVTGTTSGQGNFTVLGNGRLSGDGVIGLTAGGSVTVQDGGVLAPGASGGTLTIDGNLVLSSSSMLQFDVGGFNPSQLDVNGDLLLDGILQVTSLVGDEKSHVLINYTGTLVNNGLMIDNLPGYFVDTSVLGQVSLAQIIIPEPTSLLLMLLAIGLALPARRRRQR